MKKNLPSLRSAAENMPFTSASRPSVHRSDSISQSSLVTVSLVRNSNSLKVRKMSHWCQDTSLLYEVDKLRVGSTYKAGKISVWQFM